MADYQLVSSFTTVQVLSPTLTDTVEYTTIRTNGSQVIASMAVSESDFTGGTATVLLNDFAQAIDIVMGRPEIIAGVGTQTIDPTGLLSDNVVFTVQYVSANTPPSGVTAEAVVPVGILSTAETIGGQTSMAQVDAILNAVYDSLKSAAGD